MQQNYDHDFGILVRSKLIELNLEEVNNMSETYNLTHTERKKAIEHSLKQIYGIVGVENTPDIKELAESIYNRYNGKSYRNFPKLKKPYFLEGSINSIGKYTWKSEVIDESDWSNKVNIVLSVVECCTGEYSCSTENINALFKFFTARPVFSYDVLCRQIEESMKLLYNTEITIKLEIL